MLQGNTKGTAGATGGRERTPGESSLVIDVHDVAALLKCSARHVWRLTDSGRLPRPYAIGALRSWDRAAIQQWVRDGCPSCRKAVRR
jgi:predicted DNA-binding transcriptional regulator AlpA